jgi:hypothetical protein
VPGIVILADEEDLLAIRVAAALRRDRCPVTVLTPTQLSLGCEWSHTLSGPAATTHLRLRSEDREVVPLAVLNRLPASPFFPAKLWGSPADAGYAEAEFQALLASWLASLECLVLGPAKSGLLSQQLGLFEWLSVARDVGLPVQAITLANDASAHERRGRVMLDPFTPGRILTPAEAYVIGRNPVLFSEPLGDLHSAYVVGRDVFDVPEHDLAPAVARLAERTGCTLLECRFGRTSSGSWVLCGATSTPHDGSPALVGAIATRLATAAQVAA